MENHLGFVSTLLIATLLACICLVQAVAPSGFVSLACGLMPKNMRYVSKRTNLTYTSDANFIRTGESREINDEYKNYTFREHWSLRSFPEGRRNCYNLILQKGDKYLIRALFLHGNYDNSSGLLPTFDLYLGPNFWATVRIQEPQKVEFREAIYVLSSDNLQICLVKTQTTTPFITTLELRPLNNAYADPPNGFLSLWGRSFLTKNSNNSIRYREDVHDRIWEPWFSQPWLELSTNLTVDPNNNHNPPQRAIRTAAIAKNVNTSLHMNWNGNANPNSGFYVVFYIAELEVLKPNESRKFTISYNGQLLTKDPFVPTLTATNFTFLVPTNATYNFAFDSTKDSTKPPLVNAVEAYKVRKLSESETHQIDVNAVTGIMENFGLQGVNMQGDPCAPREYKWETLNCSYNNPNPSRIISLNLSNNGLKGMIPASIFNLTALKVLNLSSNSLNGTVPDFLAKMDNLSVIDLSWNQLTGPVPSALLERKLTGLKLVVRGNKELCKGSNLCKNETKSDKKRIVVVVPVLTVCFAFAVVVSVIFLSHKRSIKERFINPVKSINLRRSTLGLTPLTSTNQRFTMQRISRITNNFGRVIGKGGFGTVYHGRLEDKTEVAVKMLSPSSRQGFEEFEAEAKLLMTVHHKNLTSLIGYCDEGTHMALVYEYMAKGNLQNLLSGGCTLNWEQRLRIAIGAAQGLEYLHEFVNPPVIHRDVKTSNILLDEKFTTKLADFGLSKAFPMESCSAIATKVCGTPGYIDPEYFVLRRLTKKSDCYSFGVVLLEMVTGKAAIIRESEERTIHIVNWVREKIEDGNMNDWVDPHLSPDDYDPLSVKRFVDVAMSCLSTSPNDRPNMSIIVRELKECLNMEAKQGNVLGEGPSGDSLSSGCKDSDVESIWLGR